MEQYEGLLPGGWVDAAAQLHQSVVLKPLTGREEILLAEHGRRESASLVTKILSHCIERIGSIRSVTEDLTRNLLVADRHYLLLKLRELTFGPRVQATLSCPWPDCGKKVDINFSLSDLPVTPSQNKGPVYRLSLSDDLAIKEKGEIFKEISFRLPNGADQEIVSPLLAKNEAQAFALLLERCILSIGPNEAPASEMIKKLSPAARFEIEKAMERLAPKVALELDVHCPECGRDFSAPFDPQDFFFGELRSSRDLLYREVHYLAYHYHWSENEIMEMPKTRRQDYIAILSDEIERLNSAV